MTESVDDNICLYPDYLCIKEQVYRVSNQKTARYLAFQK